ncbi:MAG: nitronate monooxygenase [Tissierellia bacterium]|nr:nitronate monooxygenase [Tissierellia bacterium]
MKINEVLNIKYPILQGAMAHVSKAETAAAVSHAGGLGMIATGGFTPEEVRNEIRKIKTLTDKPFGVNLVLIHPMLDEIKKVILEEDVKIIACGAGNPAPHFPEWIEHGLKVIPIIANIKMAKKVEKLGAVACVFEGNEAGGHIGSLNTMAALVAICEAVDIPVVSAGGIYTGKQMLAAEVLGASGVQMATRFLVGKETEIHENIKNFLIEAKDSDTIVTGFYSGHPVRVVKNKLAQKLYELEKEAAPSEEFEKYGVGSNKKAVVDGDIEWGSVMAGEGLAYLTKIEPISDIIENTIEEYKMAKENICK